MASAEAEPARGGRAPERSSRSDAASPAKPSGAAPPRTIRAAVKKTATLHADQSRLPDVVAFADVTLDRHIEASGSAAPATSTPINPRTAAPGASKSTFRKFASVVGNVVDKVANEKRSGIASEVGGSEPSAAGLRARKAWTRTLSKLKDAKEACEDLESPAKGLLRRTSTIRPGTDTAAARLEFLNEHPFFKDTNPQLRVRLASELVRRTSGQAPSSSSRKRSNTDSGSEYEILLQQGSLPDNSTDYLFFISTDTEVKAEVFFDGRVVATLGHFSVIGQEVIFGLATRFCFTVRMRTVDTRSLWVIPGAVCQELLGKGDKDDGKIGLVQRAWLQERAHESITGLFRDFLQHPTAPVRLRLLDSTSHKFRAALVEVVDIQIGAAGSNVCVEGGDLTECMCIFRGEAVAKIDGVPIALLIESKKHSSWAPWWGLLEMMGTCRSSLATVTLKTDCILWRLNHSTWSQLHARFPEETQLFTMVASEHLRLLQERSVSPTQSSLFRGCATEYLSSLIFEMQHRIYLPGAEVTKCHDSEVGEVFFIARGQVSAAMERTRKTMCKASSMATSRGSVDRLQDVEAEPMMHLTEGDWFGFLFALGFSRYPIVSATTASLCQLRVIGQQSLVNLLCKHPKEVKPWLLLAESRGFAVTHVPGAEIAQFEVLKGMSQKFIDLIEQADRMVAFKDQLIMAHGQMYDSLFVLLSGRLVLEVGDVPVAEIAAPTMLGDMNIFERDEACIGNFRSQRVSTYRCVPLRVAIEFLEGHPEDLKRLQNFAWAKREDLRMLLAGENSMRTHLYWRQWQGDTKKHSEDKDEEEDEQPEMHERHLQEETQGVSTDDLKVFFGEGGDPEFLRQVHGLLRKVAFFKGQIIYLQGEKADSGLLIQSGAVHIEINGQKVGEVLSGGFIGEAVLLGKQSKRMATVRAADITVAYSLEWEDVAAMFEQFPSEKELFETVSELRATANKVMAVPTLVHEYELVRRGARQLDVEDVSNSLYNAGIQKFQKPPHVPSRLDMDDDSLTSRQKTAEDAVVDGDQSRVGAEKWVETSLTGKVPTLGVTARSRKAFKMASSMAAVMAKLSADGRVSSAGIGVAPASETTPPEELDTSGASIPTTSSSHRCSTARGSSRPTQSSRPGTSSLSATSGGSRHGTSSLSLRPGTSGSATSAEQEVSAWQHEGWTSLPPTVVSKAAQAASANAQRWAHTRWLAMGVAGARRKEREERSGRLLPVTLDSSGFAHQRRVDRGPSPLRQRFLAEVVGQYGHPVWHELYGK